MPRAQPPAPPTWQPPVVTAGAVSLAWTCDADDLQSLVLRRSNGALWRPLSPWAAGGNYAFSDTTVAAGTGYAYRVRVRDTVGHVVDGPTLDITAI